MKPKSLAQARFGVARCAGLQADAFKTVRDSQNRSTRLLNTNTSSVHHALRVARRCCAVPSALPHSAHCSVAVRPLPNPALERTSTGMARYAHTVIVRSAGHAGGGRSALR